MMVFQKQHQDSDFTSRLFLASWCFRIQQQMNCKHVDVNRRTEPSRDVWDSVKVLLHQTVRWLLLNSHSDYPRGVFFL